MYSSPAQAGLPAESGSGPFSLLVTSPYSPAVCHCLLCLSLWLLSILPVNLCHSIHWASLCILFCLWLPGASPNPPTSSIPPSSLSLSAASLYSVSSNPRAQCPCTRPPPPSISGFACLCLSPQSYFSLTLSLCPFCPSLPSLSVTVYHSPYFSVSLPPSLCCLPPLPSLHPSGVCSFSLPPPHGHAIFQQIPAQL